MNYVILSVINLLVLLAFANARQCPSSKDLCVPVRLCPHIYEAIISERAHKNATLQEYILTRACHTFGIDVEPRVCCEPSRISLGKRCTTSRKQAGKCVGSEHCQPIAKYVKRNRRNATVEFRLAQDVCYQQDDKVHYCCPEGSIIEPASQTHQQSLLKIENDFRTCRDSAGDSGLCVPIRHCDRIYSAFLDSRIHNDVKLANFVYASSCPSDAKEGHSVCCAMPPNSKSKAAAFIHHSKASKLGLTKCGSVRIVDKILKGSQAGFGQYPWMANLLYKRKGTLKSLCSGSLIHQRYVLTAAHCMKGSTRPVSVRLGEYDLQRNPDCVDGVCAGAFRDYTIEKLIPNMNFDGFNADNDIALIRLTKKVTLSEGEIFPICLPLTEDLLMLRPSKLIVTGWGMTEHQKPSTVLLEAELQTVKRMELCEGESTFCARGKNMGTHCQGDSGGPYQTIVPYKGGYKYVQFGVISGGPGQCSVKEKRPGVGVMVGYHINWILDNMNV